ncbi:unnamed protein product, partial [Mesorhabditis belari]|uniref:ZP domain-containing protein n=1 Tax=Mesorhabditis belari TaxID=2138241 RepID=A0AAF3EZZ1_9BILA
MQAEPMVSCAADAIYVKLRTKSTFIGHVTVRYAPNNECYQILITNNQIEVLIPHQDCALPRKRLHSPDGLLISAELVLSFHQNFLTKDDLVYKFDCLHLRKNGTKLENGQQMKPETGDYLPETSPHCEYNIKSSRNGRLLHSAAIGDVVYHEWSCRNTGNDCLLVRNCFFVTPDQRYPLIGGNGCTLDEYVLPELHYYNHRLVAQNVSVFGVAQKPVVFFECEMVLSERNEDGCPPPKCSNFEEQRTKRTRKSIKMIEVQSQRIEISELKKEAESDDSVPSERSLDMALVECADPSQSSSTLCMSTTAFALSTTLTTLILISSISAVLYLICRKEEYAGVHDGL